MGVRDFRVRGNGLQTQHCHGRQVDNTSRFRQFVPRPTRFLDQFRRRILDQPLRLCPILGRWAGVELDDPLILFRHPQEAGFAFTSFYTWGKSIDEASDDSAASGIT